MTTRAVPGDPAGAAARSRLARSLPATTGVGLGLRLAAADARACSLPGMLVARALRDARRSAARRWRSRSRCFAGASASCSSSTRAIALAPGDRSRRGARRAAVRVRRGAARRGSPGACSCSALGVRFGIALWRVAGAARRRRALPPRARAEALAPSTTLSLLAVDEFRDGGLHPGYAFPLWHGVPRARRAARRASTRALVVLHEATRARAARVRSSPTRRGRRSSARARSASPSCSRQVALSRSRRARRRVRVARAAGDGRPAAARAGRARALLRVRARAAVAWLGCARAPAALALALVHPTYALFLCVPLAGFLVARALLSHARRHAARRWRSPRSLVPAGLSCALARCRSSRETASHTPSARRAAARASRTTPGSSTSSRTTATGSRRRSSAAAARSRSPRSLLRAARRARAPAPLGGVRARRSLAVLAVDARAASSSRASPTPSRSRRPAGPPASSRSRSRSPAARPCSPGSSRRACCRSRSPPGIAAAGRLPRRLRLHARGRRAGARRRWVAAARRRRRAGRGALPAAASSSRSSRRGAARGGRRALFVLPVAVQRLHALDRRATARRPELTPGLVRRAPRDAAEGRRRLLRLETSYRIAAFAPVYVARRAAGPRRRHAGEPAVRAAPTTSSSSSAPATLAIPRRYGADWLVVDRARSRLDASTLPLRLGRRSRYVLYRLPMKVLLVTLYFPPAGGGGVQRPLKFATHLPGARDRDARARARRPEVDPPRRRAAAADAGVGAPRALPRPARPPAGRGAARHDGPRARARRRRGSFGRRLLVPDENVTLEPDRDPGRDPDRAAARGSTS